LLVQAEQSLPRPGASFHRRVGDGKVAFGGQTDHAVGEGAVAGPDLDDREWIRTPQVVPQLGEGAKQQLGEDGMDVGARDEVPVVPDGRALVEPLGPVERAFHELGKGDRALLADRVHDVPEDPVAHLIRPSFVYGWSHTGDKPEITHSTNPRSPTAQTR